MKLLIALLCAATVVEPFRPEIVQQLGGGNLGLILYHSIRFMLFAAFLARLYFTAQPLRLEARRVTQSSPDPLLTLRAFACLCVVMGHGTVLIFPPANFADQLAAGSLYWLAMPSPWVGVWTFFVLSGYLMGKGFYSGRYTFDRAGIFRFYRNRFLRIAPMYWFVVIAVSLLVTPAILKPEYLWNLAVIMLGLQQQGLPIEPVGAMWSVQTEISFYVAVPVLFVLLHRAMRNPLLMMAMLAGAGVAYRIAFIRSGWAVTVLTPLIANLDLFLIGISANWLVPKIRVRVGLGLVVLGVLYVVGAYFYALANFAIEGRRTLILALNICVGPAVTAGAVALAIAFFEGKPHAKLSPATAAIIQRTQWLGVISYALYLWHAPLFLYAGTLTQSTTAAASFFHFALAAISVIALAGATYIVVERPFELRKRVATA